MATLTEMVRRVVDKNPRKNDDEITELLIRDLLALKDPVSVMRPALRGYIASFRRARVRTVERSVSKDFARIPTSSPQPVALDDPAAPRRMFHPSTPQRGPSTQAVVLRRLLNQYVKVPGRPDILWGDLTRRDIADRVRMFQKQISGGRDAIERLQLADAFIVSVGARTLREAVAKAA